MLTIKPPPRGRAANTALEQAFAAARLTPRQRHIVIQRVNGRSFRAIALDAAISKAGGSPVTRQRVQQIERDALRKLKIDRDTLRKLKPRGSSVACLHEEERLARAETLTERGRRVTHTDLRHDREEVRPRWQSSTPDGKEAARLAALADRFIQEVEGAGPGGLSPEREAFYRDEAARAA